MIKKHQTLSDLIKENLNTPEPKSTANLILEMKPVNSRGFLTKEEFIKICMWKSPRPKKYYLSNSEEKVMEITRECLSSESEEHKIEKLTELNGISIAVGSAILTVVDPINYGVIDIRVWQLLHLYGEVNTKPSGKGFNIQDWINYLDVLRKYAEEFNCSVRDIERTLFFHHRFIQEGVLYK